MRLSTKTIDHLSSLRDPAGTRTQDPNIKSVMLYQLSYEIGFKPFRLKWRKYRIIEFGVQALFDFIFRPN